MRSSLVLLALTLMSVSSPAVLCTSRTSAYSQAVESGQNGIALSLLFKDLSLAPDERKRIVLQPGLAQHNGHRNAEADPETFTIAVDPDLLAEGEIEGCEDLVHELTHLHHFYRDHEALVAHFAQMPSSATWSGWKGCDEDPGVNASSAARVASAFDCLMDNDLVPHAAAYEIEAVLAQTQAIQGPLRSDDEEDLIYYMNRFDQAWATVTSRRNETYYLPSLKTEDRLIYCQGSQYLERLRGDDSHKAHCP